MPFFFFRHVFFFLGVWVEVSYFFCLDGGFKVGNTHHFFIHLEEFHSLPVFFLRCFGSNLAQFDENFGGCNFRGPWEFTQKMGGCWCFRVFPKSEWFMGCCTPPNEALCSCKNTETLDFWFGHKFYSLRGADCWTSWNWSTFAGRAFCGILPGAKSVGRLWRCRFGAQGETDCYGFLGTDANTAKMPCLTLRTWML